MRIQEVRSFQIYLAALTAMTSAVINPVVAQTSDNINVPGVASGSPGQEGMDDEDDSCRKAVKFAGKHSTTDSAYAQALIDLGMHLSRQNKFVESEKVLNKAIHVMDAGAIKPSTETQLRDRSPTRVEHSNGTVAAISNDTPSNYDMTIENLLPALIAAEIHTSHFKAGEQHSLRLIEFAQSGRIPRVPALMFAFRQYSELLQKQGRTKEADNYKQKADEMNSKIIGL